jgi:hypothetical protein
MPNHQPDNESSIAQTSTTQPTPAQPTTTQLFTTQSPIIQPLTAQADSASLSSPSSSVSDPVLARERRAAAMDILTRHRAHLTCHTLPNGTCRYQALLPPARDRVSTLSTRGALSARPTAISTTDYDTPEAALEALDIAVTAAERHAQETSLLRFLTAWSHGTYTPWPQLNADTGLIEWLVLRVSHREQVGDVTYPGPLNVLQEIARLMES